MSTLTPKHEVKSWPEFYREIVSGSKKHDLRRADDRQFEVGDIMRYREWDPRTQKYTGSALLVKITYKTEANAPCALSPQALDPKFCILSIEVLKEEQMEVRNEVCHPAGGRRRFCPRPVNLPCS